ncbi:Arm DNA-binding domain-containing protein [Thiothrix lacustris]|uniref:Arm DNA-binding domain-containing protein n=1 Tax=Thiothrix lacustris TaxID=525917 RepID=UPI0027E56041|nr:Arm DNA-binding domain-containing protein [Thiothrix lacustris]WMP17780.1 Arm DNA-binding domain-containing protein [Thiothrix lacustris]
MTNKLTIGQIKRLPTPLSGYVEHSANSIPGLRIRCTSRGVKSWVFRYKSAGKNNVITLGRG